MGRMSLLLGGEQLQTELIISVRGWFCRYILFYLTAVATEENLSLVYHVAQRVKQFRDGLTPENSDVTTSLFPPSLHSNADTF